MRASRASGDGIPASSVVLLLTAGYAAPAGLVVTFLVGYPLTWSTALIASSLVCAGALLTARVVAAPVDTTGDADIAPTQPPHGKPGFSRRRFISLAGGAVVASTGTSGVGLLFMPAETASTGGGPGRSSSSGPAVSVAAAHRPRRASPADSAAVNPARLARIRSSARWTRPCRTASGPPAGPA